MERLKYKVFFLSMYSFLAICPSYTFGMAGLVEGAETSVVDSLSSSLGEGLSRNVADIAGSTVKDVFENVPERELTQNITPEVSEAAFSKLGSELEQIFPKGEANIVGISADQVDRIGTALTGTVEDLQKALPEGVRISDQAVKDSITALKSELTSTADAFVKDSTDLVEVAGEAGGAAEAGAASRAAVDVQGETLVKAETGIEGSIKELNESIKDLGERIEKMSPEEAQATWKGKIWGFVKQHMLIALFGAFIFMVPNWVMGAIQAALTRQAKLATMRAPQNVGGVWVQIPEPLIDTQNVDLTLPLYSRVIDKNVEKMFDTISNGAGEWAGSDAPQANIDNANFFVSSGNYDNCAVNYSWGAAAIVSPNFAGQMIHLNSGLEFLGDGMPANDSYPYRMLYPLNAKDITHNCVTNMLTYIYYLAGRLNLGQPFTETYDMYSGTGIFTTQGSVARAQGGGSARRDLNYTQGLSKIFYSDSAKNIFTTPTASIGQQAGKLASASSKALDYLKKILPSTSTYDQMSGPFNVGPVTVRVNDERVSGGFTLQAMQKPDASVLELVGVDASNLNMDQFNAPLPAQSYFVYQTADTPWAVQARRLLKGRPVNVAPHLYDYVISLDESNTPVPALVPVIQPEKPNTVAAIVWSTNPNVRFLYSIVNQTAFDISTGKVSVNPYIDLTKVAAASVPATLMPLFNGLSTGAFANELKQGPFQYGTFTLAVPDILKKTGAYQTVFVYECAPEANKNGTTLEGSFTDYLVPVDSFFAPVQLPSPKHVYFVSLVTSRIYSPDLTLVKKPVDFSILLDPKTQQVYIATSNVLTAFLSQGAQIACTQSVQKTYTTKGCEDLTAPLGTLYQEYDLNPYNQPVLSVLPNIVFSIAQNIKASTDAVYSSAKASNAIDRIATYAASRVVSSLQALGLTPAVIQGLLGFWASNKEAALKSVGAVIAGAITSTLSKGIAQNLITTDLAHASPNDLNKLLSATSNPAIASAFEHIGTTSLKTALTPAAQTLFDGLSTSLGIDPGQNYQVTLAEAGLIGVGPFYLYQRGMNLGPQVQGQDQKSRALLADYLTSQSSGLMPLHISILRSHTLWRLGLMGKQPQQWLLYEQFGPFSFTTNQIPNVLIQAVSLEALQQGDFVYQSSTAPGDFFIVASVLQADNSVPSVEPFNAVNPQPYLISLVNGTVYQRNDQGALVNAFDKNGMPLKISNLAALQSGLKNTQLRKMLDVQTSTKPPSLWKRYSFANFLLTIDPQDVANGTYIYQDITSVAAFPPSISQITDFFVGVSVVNGAIQQPIGIPLEANPTHIVSLISGIFYNAQGATDMSLPSSLKPQDLVGMVSKGKTLRTALRNAIDLLIGQQQASLPPVKTPTGPTMSLDSGIASALLSSSVPYLSAPYQWLKFYNGKYYAVTGAPGDPKGSTLQTIFDYAGPMVRGAQVGALYNSQGYATAFYEGALLDVMRSKAGVAMAGSSQVLSVPATVGVLDLSKNSTLSAFTPPLTASMPDGTYTLLEYTNKLMPGLRVLADFKPVGQEAPYYVDFYTGTQFTHDGNPRIAQYPVRTSKGRLVFARGVDAAKNPRFFGQGPDGYYFDLAFYRDFTSTKNPEEVFKGFQAVGNANTYIAVKPANLGRTVSWVVKTGQMKTLPSGGPVIAFDPEGVTFGPETNQKFARSYSYIGTGPSTVFEGPKIQWDPNYANAPLIALGAESLFVSSLTKDNRLATLPAGAYIECKAAGAQGQGKVFQGVLPGGQKSDYSVTFYDNLTDPRTGASYVCLVDANGKHFYVPDYQSTDAQTLLDVQKQLNGYISLTAYGDIGIFKPLPNVVNLKAIAAVLNVPEDQVANVQASILQSNQFLYDAENKRYLYQFTDADQQAPYAPPAQASYVDLRSGVLYDATGIPTGGALTYPQLVLLFTLQGIALPLPTDDPSKMSPRSNSVTVPASATLTKDTPALLYAPKP